MRNDDIQKIYNQTKHVNSPSELDRLILNKIQDDFNQSTKDDLVTKNTSVFFSLAASLILVVALTFFMPSENPSQLGRKPLEIAKIDPVIKKAKNKNGQTLPLETYYPFAAKDKIVLMCGQLPNPATHFKWADKNKKTKTSTLPKLNYPYNLKNKLPPNLFCKRLNRDHEKIELVCGVVSSKQDLKSKKDKLKASSLPKLNYPYELKNIPQANVFCKPAETDSDKLVCGFVPVEQNPKTHKRRDKSNAAQLPELKYPYSIEKNLDPEALCKQILKDKRDVAK